MRLLVLGINIGMRLVEITATIFVAYNLRRQSVQRPLLSLTLSIQRTCYRDKSQHSPTHLINTTNIPLQFLLVHEGNLLTKVDPRNEPRSPRGYEERSVERPPKQSPKL